MPIPKTKRIASPLTGLLTIFGLISLGLVSYCGGKILRSGGISDGTFIGSTLGVVFLAWSPLIRVAFSTRRGGSGRPAGLSPRGTAPARGRHRSCRRRGVPESSPRASLLAARTVVSGLSRLTPPLIAVENRQKNSGRGPLDFSVD